MKFKFSPKKAFPSLQFLSVTQIERDIKTLLLKYRIFAMECAPKILNIID